MRKSKYSDSQVLAILNQNESGISIPDLCREHFMSSAQFYKWRAKFGGMDASLMKIMKELEEENKRLKKCMLKSGSKPKYGRRLLRESCKAISA